MADDGIPNINTVAVTGPVIMGHMAAIMLYGVLLAQASNFVSSPGFHRSSITLRLAILWVLCLVTVSVGLGINDIWHFSTLFTDDLSVVLNGTFPQTLEPLFCGLISVSVQTILVLRVSKVIAKVWLRWTFIFVLLGASLVSLYGAIADTVWSIKFRSNQAIDLSGSLGLNWDAILQIWLWTAAGIDSVISGVYVFILYQRLGGGTETTNNVLRMIVLCAIRTAAYTAVFAITSSITGQVFGLSDYNTSLICYAFWEPLPVLYGLSLFTTLSIADNVRGRLSDPMLRPASGMNGNSAGGPGSHPRYFLSDVAPSFTNAAGARPATASGLGLGRSGDPLSMAENGEGTKSGDSGHGASGGTGTGEMRGLGQGVGVRVEVEKVVDDERERRASLL
ncbi:hypothetical protein JCM10207_002288 [Rhodosporidiobolus poonsookiae]